MVPRPPSDSENGVRSVCLTEIWPRRQNDMIKTRRALLSATTVIPTFIALNMMPASASDTTSSDQAAFRLAQAAPEPGERRDQRGRPQGQQPQQRPGQPQRPPGQPPQPQRPAAQPQ